MRPLELYLKNSIGIQLGLGLSEIRLDLSDLSGLVALIGGNGKGKSTILDSLHPFRVMPYSLRSSDSWEPTAFCYYDHFFGRDAAKELTFEHGGAKYRSLILIDADRRKQECYLYRDEGGQWVPYNEEVKAGGTKAYDAAVEQLVASPSLFFSAVFRSQGAQPLSECKRSEIMGVVAELLNVDHVLAQGEKARKAAGSLQKIVDAENVRLSALMAEVAQTAEVKARLDVLRALLQEKQAQADRLRADIAAAADAVADLKARVARAAEDRERLADLRRQQGEVVADIVGIREAIAAAEKSRRERLGAVQDRLNRDLADVTHREAVSGRLLRESEEADAIARELLTAKREKVRKIMDHAGEIRAKVAEEVDKRGELELARGDMERLAASLAAAQEEERKLHVTRQSLSAARATLAAEVSDRELRTAKAKQELAAAEREAARLAGFACAGRDPQYAGCVAIKSAMAAKEELPGLRRAVAFHKDPDPAEREAEAEVERLTAEEAALSWASPAVESAATAHSTQRGAVAAVEATLADLARWTRLLPELDHAEATLAEVTTAEANADASLVAARERAETTRQELAKRRDELTHAAAMEQSSIVVECDRHEEGLDDRLTAARLKAADLDVQAEALAATLGADLTAELAAAEERSATLAADLSAVERERADALGRQGADVGRLEDLTKKGEAAAALRARVRRIEAEAAHLSLLAKACSNDGVVALELDDSAPLIAAITNDLLKEFDGGRWSVRFETQRAKVSGGVAEDFDVTVFDAESGQGHSLFRKSGGQVVTIDDALARGFRLFVANRSKTPFLTLFNDERDGQLDEERRREFYAIKRKALELGDHVQEVFITHSSELAEMADARIIFGDGQIRVEA